MTYSTQLITKPVPNRKIVISEELWLQTWLGLRARGSGKVESSAVWGGKRDDSTETVEAVYFLDDWDGGCQEAAYHCVSPEALEQLFRRLKEERKVLVGDIHSHPTEWVGLSPLDKANPIEFRKGLYAIVLPRYALPSPALSSAGVHEYAGNGRWRALSQKAKKELFTFT